MKIRTFIALDIPNFVVEKIFEILTSQVGDKKVKWQSKDKIHLTLKFIGDFEQKLIPELVEKLNFLNDLQTQKIELTEFGFFYTNKSPRVFWIKPVISKELIKTVDEIEEVLLQYDIPKEKRKFSPHLTLLKIKNDEKVDFLNKLITLKFEPIVFESNLITLYKSDLHPSGAIYNSLHKFQLKKMELI